MKRWMHSLALFALCTPLAAQAVEGWVIDDISLHAGPDPAYPSITELAAGTPVSIQGCIDGWIWCDVVAGPDRGWVPGTFLEEDYGGQRVVIIDYGPRIGIPVVSFSLGLYWDRHYHDRPFYLQREQWLAKAIKPNQPRRPAKAVAVSRAPATTQPSPATTSPMRTQPTAQQPPARTTQRAAQPTITARATPPKRHETPQPKTNLRQSPSDKPESQAATASMAKARPRAGEPKPKDELKKPKAKQDKRDQDGGGDGQH